MNMFPLDGKTALVMGAIRGHPATEFPTEDWDHVTQINQDAVFLLCPLDLSSRSQVPSRAVLPGFGGAPF